jgi:hypothetical protein
MSKQSIIKSKRAPRSLQKISKQVQAIRTKRYSKTLLWEFSNAKLVPNTSGLDQNFEQLGRALEFELCGQVNASVLLANSGWCVEKKKKRWDKRLEKWAQVLGVTWESWFYRDGAVLWRWALAQALRAAIQGRVWGPARTLSRLVSRSRGRQ